MEELNNPSSDTKKKDEAARVTKTNLGYVNEKEKEDEKRDQKQDLDQDDKQNDIDNGNFNTSF
jgi:nucleosome binding factor SPN SPT16 subunit